MSNAPINWTKLYANYNNSRKITIDGKTGFRGYGATFFTDGQLLDITKGFQNVVLKLDTSNIQQTTPDILTSDRVTSLNAPTLNKPQVSGTTPSAFAPVIISLAKTVGVFILPQTNYIPTVTNTNTHAAVVLKSELFSKVLKLS